MQQMSWVKNQDAASSIPRGVNAEIMLGNGRGFTGNAENPSESKPLETNQ